MQNDNPYVSEFCVTDSDEEFVPSTQLFDEGFDIPTKTTQQQVPSPTIVNMLTTQ